MRLVTYDRGGARRLGALVGPAVVDLPDAVGHPAFPSTMEALVARNRGTTLDIARSVLSDPEIVRDCTVPDPRLLVPFLPPLARERILTTGDVVPWPPAEDYLDLDPQIACIAGRDGRGLTIEDAARAIFGYTTMAFWSGTRFRRNRIAVSFGPCIVTADEFDPAGGSLVTRIDGEVRAEAPLALAAATFAEMIAAKSLSPKGVRAGVVFGSALSGRGHGLGIPLGPETVVEIEAPALGVLRAELGRRASRTVDASV